MNLFKRLFKKIKDRVTTEELQLREYSQEHIMQHYMRRADIKHEEKVVVNLRNVRIERTSEYGIKKNGELTLFFCPMDEIQVIKRLTQGDYGSIPGSVKLHNFKVPKSMKKGTYDIKNVILHANGSINVISTELTSIESVNY